MTPEEQDAVERLKGPERRKCACRSDVTVLINDDRGITAAVVDHQMNDFRHRLWSAAGGMDQMLTPEERHKRVPAEPFVRSLAVLRRTG